MKNTADIREFLIVQMKLTASGKADIGTAKAVCNFAQQIYNTLQLEMAAARLKDKIGSTNIPAIHWESPPSTENKEEKEDA